MYISQSVLLTQKIVTQDILGGRGRQRRKLGQIHCEAEVERQREGNGDEYLCP